MDARTDVFSLASVVYEMLTAGRRMGRRRLRDAGETSDRHAAPPSQVRRSCPSWLDEIVLKGSRATRRPGGRPPRTSGALAATVDASTSAGIGVALGSGGFAAG